MDFTSTHAVPFRITIDGKPYDLPRFLLPQFKEWVANRQKKQIDTALAQFGDDADARARFLLYWQPAPVDLQQMIQDALTPEGVEHVVGTQMTVAGVPEEQRKALLTNGDPLRLSTLAGILCSGSVAVANMKRESEDPGRAGDPLAERQPTSGDSGTTMPPISPSSAPASPATTQAA